MCQSYSAWKHLALTHLVNILQTGHCCWAQPVMEQRVLCGALYSADPSRSSKCQIQAPITTALCGPVASTGRLMRSAAPARDLRGFMEARAGGGCACACAGSCASAAASAGTAMLKRPRGGGFPERCLAGPAASLAACSAGMADWRRAGGFEGTGAALSSACSPGIDTKAIEHEVAGHKMMS